jgi:hypothetical protein
MTSQYVIEKDVPLPDRRTKYPWDEMVCGDSFFVAGKTAQQLSPPAFYAGKKRTMRFRALDVESGVRVWRVA